MTIAPELLASAAALSPASFDPDALYDQLCAQRPDLQPLLTVMRNAPAARRREVQPSATVEQRLERLKGAYADLYERMSALAAALGACARCWGEDVSCPRCGGAGEPGAWVPDRNEFRHYVLPALQAVRTARAAAAPPATVPAPAPTSDGFETETSRAPRTYQTS